MSEKVKLFINNRQVECESGVTILEAAKTAGIAIPTLCYLKELNEIGACRICVVEVEGAKTMQASCVTPVFPGMKVKTDCHSVRKAQRQNLELILSAHPLNCPTCIRNTNCELQSLAEAFSIREIVFHGDRTVLQPDTSSPSIVREPEKCILCRRCVAVCANVQTVSAISIQGRGFDSLIAPEHANPLAESVCVACGQCTLVCPTAALHERDDTERVWAALADPRKHVIVQTAPATRVSLGEEFGMEAGSIVTGQVVTALKMLGFDKVFDTDFTADLTIMEEGSELLHRLKNGGPLPLITSCSPGWINFVETFYPDLLAYLSTCKSPQQMLGALGKTYYAEKFGIDPDDIFIVSCMPCTAKKYEAQRPEMGGNGRSDIDAVLTTRELGRMMRRAGLIFGSLPETDYDEPLGISTGAALIFGATGGVMEAALRTAYELVTNEDVPSLEFHACRGLAGVKEATVKMNGLAVRVAVVSSLGQARRLLDVVRDGKADYHFIEVMCCPGGCIGGGGQPIPTNLEVKSKRLAATYTADERMVIRKSHLNQAVQKLYQDFLGEPLGHKSHELLHTEYQSKKKAWL